MLKSIEIGSTIEKSYNKYSPGSSSGLVLSSFAAN